MKKHLFSSFCILCILLCTVFFSCNQENHTDQSTVLPSNAPSDTDEASGTQASGDTALPSNAPSGTDEASGTQASGDTALPSNAPSDTDEASGTQAPSEAYIPPIELPTALLDMQKYESAIVMQAGMNPFSVWYDGEKSAVFNFIDFVDESVPTHISKSFFDTEYSLVYTHSRVLSQSDGIVHCYKVEGLDEFANVWLDATTGQLVSFSLFPHGQSLDTKKDYTDFISTFDGENLDLSKYDERCYTYLKRTLENASTYKNEIGFYPVEELKENEEFKEYKFYYQKAIDENIKIPDYIEVRFDSEGRMSRKRTHNTIDEESISLAISSFEQAKDEINAFLGEPDEKYSVIKRVLYDFQLVEKSGRLFLLAMTEVTFVENDDPLANEWTTHLQTATCLD